MSIPTSSAARAAELFKAAWSALITGSRSIPFGDNGGLYRELAARCAARRRS